MTPIIRTSKLSKKYHDLLAVDHVNLEVNEGECFGLLGPNGAGKTSLIKMITAVMPPTSGDAWILDYNLKTHPRQAKAILGVVPQIDNLDPDLTVLQNLMTFSRYFDIPKAEALKRSLTVLKLFSLEEKAASYIEELSGGMKRRLLIARGFINNPKIVILDEPTIGLDPQAKFLVWRKLTELKEQGITQLLCTQNMDEARYLCDRIAIMSEGSIVSLDTPQNLIAQFVGKDVWEISVNPVEKHEVIKALEQQGLLFEDVGTRIHVYQFDDMDALADIVGSSDKLHRRQANLEDVFFKLTGRSMVE